jgi:hypothetical protein
MSLYLCVFSADAELDGVDAGPYADFNALREFVVRELEQASQGSPQAPAGAGSRFPTLILHSDCDGEWTADACKSLRHELAAVLEEARLLQPRPFASEWQQRAAAQAGLVPRNASECFVDVDGAPLLERLRALVETALAHAQPILFQ